MAVYGLLLNSDPKHPISRVMHEHWSEIHHLTGSEIALVAFDPPVEWTNTLKDYWKKQLGAAFDETWQRWQRPPDAGVALSYLGLFNKAEIKAADLPCLVLFTELDKPQAVVRSLPAWDPDKLYRLLLGMFDDVRSCCAEPKESRLECLRTSNKTSLLPVMVWMQSCDVTAVCPERVTMKQPGGTLWYRSGGRSESGKSRRASDTRLS